MEIKKIMDVLTDDKIGNKYFMVLDFDEEDPIFGHAVRPAMLVDIEKYGNNRLFVFDLLVVPNPYHR